MSINIEKYSKELRSLTDAYYNQQISYEEYQLHRKIIFDHIDLELRGNPAGVGTTSGGLLDKVLSHFKSNESAN